MPDIQGMIGKEVEVFANSVKYTGVLIEVSDEEVHLRSSLQWITLPSASVGEIRLKDVKKPEEGNVGQPSKGE